VELPEFLDRCCDDDTRGLAGWDASALDVDGDGHVDVVVADNIADSGVVWLLRGRGDGTLAPASSLLLDSHQTGGQLLYHAIHDFDADGHLDLVAHRYVKEDAVPSRELRDYQLLFYAGDNAGGFQAPVILPIEMSGLNTVDKIMVHDVNQDGHDDLMLQIKESRGFEGEDGRNRPRSLQVLYSYGDGRFAEPHILTMGHFGHVTIRDMNGDGLPDFVLSGGGLLGNGIEVVLQEEPFRLPDVFVRGECNDDGGVDISDAVFILNWLFSGAAPPGCVASANTNGDETADLSDAVYLLTYLFMGGPAVVAPFPDCGPGLLATDEELGCTAPPDRCRQ
jgi:hypothetical protein